VLHEDLVAEERLGIGGPVAFEHHRDAGLEELRGIAVMDDRHLDAVERDRERHALGGGLHAVLHGALHTDALVAEGVPLRDGFISVVEVQRRRCEPLVRHDADGDEHHGEDAVGPQAAPAGRGRRVGRIGRRPGGQLHRRCSGGTRSAKERPRCTVRRA
jgi:hypothetical protein